MGPSHSCDSFSEVREKVKSVVFRMVKVQVESVRHVIPHLMCGWTQDAIWYLQMKISNKGKFRFF